MANQKWAVSNEDERIYTLSCYACARPEYGTIRGNPRGNRNETDYRTRSVLALLGIVGLAIPVFTTSQTKDVAKLGDFKIQSTEEALRTWFPRL